MTRQSVILIFDVGKTNKKILLFDDHYRLVFEDSTRLQEITDEDGFPCEDIDALTDWIRTSFERMLADERFDIRAVNFSAYGASFVYLDENKVPILPLYNYLKPYPENLKRKFYDQYGGEPEFSKKTASPVLGSLNSGMQLYRIKYERPKVFSRIKFALHLPQYLSSILTKRFYSEITSIGCHTNLWDFTTQAYHDWVINEGLKEKLPPILKSNVCVNIQHKDKRICIGVGLHDSSSALIPYLITFQEPFVLLSTGTWCISLNPFNNSALNKHELGKDCLCYLTYQGSPVKASRLFAGYEHEQQTKRLAEYYNIPIEQLTATEYNKSIARGINGVSSIERLKRKNRTYVFSRNHTGEFDEREEAYHQLMIDIVTKQMISTKLVLRGKPVNKIFIDGGFSRNSIYMNLMAAVFPSFEIYSSSVPQASALGAAIAIHKHWNQTPIPVDLIQLKFYPNAARS